MGVCSSNSLAIRWGTTNLIYILGLTDRGNKIKLNSVRVMFWAEPTWLRSARSYNDIRLLSAMTLQTLVTQTDCERPLCSNHLQC